ncbi:hypothetical protein [Streptomyces sp. NPDC006335]|uniref:hypothetical protein n=1 Tax=Streptomyces sp. NPDC006335 TaxID=3156895 RepID=UPI0033A8BF19
MWRLTAAPDSPVFRTSLDNHELGLAPAQRLEGHTLRHLEGGTVHTLGLGAATLTPGSRTPRPTSYSAPTATPCATAELTHDRYLIRLRSTTDGRVLHTLPSLPARLPSLPALDIDVRLVFSTDGTRLGYGVTAAGHTLSTQSFTLWDVPHERVVTALDLPRPPPWPRPRSAPGPHSAPHPPGR